MSLPWNSKLVLLQFWVVCRPFVVVISFRLCRCFTEAMSVLLQQGLLMACNRVDVFGHCPFPLAIICAHFSDQAQIYTQIDASFSRMTTCSLVWFGHPAQVDGSVVFLTSVASAVAKFLKFFCFVLCNFCLLCNSTCVEFFFVCVPFDRLPGV